MSIKKRTCLTVVCDGCGKDIEVDNDGTTMHFDDPGMARQEIETYEVGVAVPDGDFCNDCLDLPHAYIPSEVYAVLCARCAVDKDDHYAPPVAAAPSPTDTAAQTQREG